MSMNRLSNIKNPYQGKAKKVLCVCSAGLLRSPTTAWVLSNAPFNFNTRSAGINDEYALICVDEVLVEWADEIICMSGSQRSVLQEAFPKKKITSFDIPDNFGYRDPALVKIITEKSLLHFKEI